MSSVVGIGLDLVDVDRFERVLARRATIATRLFTEDERRDAGNAPERLAARFAAKEAVWKVLGVGLGAVDFHDCVVVREPHGAPSVRLRGRAHELATRRGITTIELSLSHTDRTAGAVAIGLAS